MTISGVFINGCSFLTPRPKDGVDTHTGIELAKLLETKVTSSIAMGGRGNDRISFTTKLWYGKNSKDTFDSSIECGFFPEGLTRRACIDKCMAPHRNNYLNTCTSENCAKICDDCSNESCKWKKPVGVPEPSKIRGISGNSNAKITWISPYNHGNKISAYSLFIINLQDLRTIRNDFPPEINCEVCEYIVGDLENDDEYQIYLLAKNVNGDSMK